MLADILSLPCSEDIKEKFGCLQAKQLGPYPAFQHMRQHGGPHESPLCHTKGLAFSSQAAGIYHKNTIFTLGTGKLDLGQSGWWMTGIVFGVDVKHKPQQHIFQPDSQYL